MTSATALRITTATVSGRPSNLASETGMSVLVRSQEIVEAARRKVPTFAATAATNTQEDRSAARTDTAVPPLQGLGPAAILEFPTFTPIRPLRQAFNVLAEWEGAVVAVGADSIIAQLTPISGSRSSAQTEAEIPWSEVADDDRELVCPGALFRLAVGYQSSDGTRTHFSRVVFRRLPAWNRRTLEEADDIADTYFHGIAVE